MIEQLSLSHYWLFRIGIAFGCVVILVLLGRIPVTYNLRNLRVRWKTTLSTAFAYTLVISLIIVMISYVNGMNSLIEKSGQPGNVIILSEGATDELFSNLSHADTTEIERRKGVELDPRGRPLCSREAFFVVNHVVPTPEGQPVQLRFVQVRGVEDVLISAQVHGLELKDGGRWFSDRGQTTLEGSEGDELAVETVLGSGIAAELGSEIGKESLEIGDVFDLGPKKWIVVGIIKPTGSTFDSEIWTRHQIAGPLFGKENFTSIVVRTKDEDAGREWAEDLRNNYKTTPVQAQLETEYYSNLSQMNKQFLEFLIFVSIIMIGGGACGVMNTMFAAISQRKKDIGVMRLLGFSSGQLLVSFLLESLLISLIGGAIGCALGSLADGWTAKSFLSGAATGKTVVFELIVDANAIAAGMVLTLVMGLLGGIIPALSAMSIKPLHAVR